jgi:hypothetical protein
MKDVENVTGRMGEGEVVAPTEEIETGTTADDARLRERVTAGVGSGVTETVNPRTGEAGDDRGPDPWLPLLQFGAQLAAALAAAGDSKAAGHPWIERDLSTGVQKLKVPLPAPETTGQLADALSAIADLLRGGPRHERSG